MTNAEAIETLRANYPDACFEQLREAVDVAIKALKAQDIAGDMISRQWLLGCINDGWIKFDTDKDANRFIHLVRDIAPPAQPEPSIPVVWIDGKIEWLNNMDNYFAELTANIIKTMLNEWRKGQTDNVD